MSHNFDKYKFICPRYKRDLLIELKKQKDENKFTNFILEIKDSEINAHKNILCASIPYIDRCVRNINLSKDKIDTSKIDLKFLNADAVKNIIDFIYTGELNLSGDNVKDILIACDYLCMDNLKMECNNFYCNNLNKNNCIEIFMIAKKYPAGDFENKVLKYITRNGMDLLKSRHLLILPIEEIKTILSSVDLLLSEENGFPCAPPRQEYLLLNTLMSLYNADEANNENMKIFEIVNSDVIRYYEIDENALKQLLGNSRNEALNARIRKARDTSSRNISPPRLLKEIYFESSVALGLGNDIRHHSKQFFDDSIRKDPLFLGHPQYVIGMRLYIMAWKEYTDNICIVIGGILVSYNIGEPILHGTDSYFNDFGVQMAVHEFRLDDDERIISITAGAGWMVDYLILMTNKNRKLGPYGGCGGNRHKILPRSYGGSQAYLAHLKSEVENTPWGAAVRRLQFVWGCMPEE